MSLPIFERFPALAGRLPHVPLGRYPTPIECRTLDTPAGEFRFLVKRDDVCGEPYGGNKVRKLEFLLGAAQAAGAKRLVTAGATGSHHALATTIYGRRLGFEVTLVLFPQSRNEHVREVLLLDHALGAELRFARRMESIPFALLTARLAHMADRPAMIPPGGSNAVGTIGHVNAALELAAQLDAGAVAVRPAAIHVAAGTLGTVAGLAIGLAAAGLAIPIVAHRITARIVTNEPILRRLLLRTHSLLVRHGADLPPPQAALDLVTLEHEQFGDGYGKATPAGEAAAERFASLGLTLDATYTAKAAAGLLAAADGYMHDDAAGGVPLFWHTLSAHMPEPPAGLPEIDALPPAFAEYLRR